MGSAHDTLSPVVLSVVPHTVAHCEAHAHCVVNIYDLISLPSSSNAPWDPNAWHRWNWSIALHNISPCWLVGWLSNLHAIGRHEEIFQCRRPGTSQAQSESRNRHLTAACLTALPV
jgi:hypothetical protein